MNVFIKRRWFVIASSLALVCLIAVLVSVLLRPGDDEYVRGRLPKGFDFAQVTSGKALTAAQLYKAYEPEHDPVHPVLDVRTSLRISNLGSRPGTPRPQDLDAEYPKLKAGGATTAKTEIETPLAVRPSNGSIRLKPRSQLPKVALPDFDVVGKDVPSPQFAGRSYTVSWRFTGDRKVNYEVSLSKDGGSTFGTLAKGLTRQTHTFKLPTKPVGHAVLRVTAKLDGRVYRSADTSEFAVVAAPRPVPKVVKNFVDPQVKYVGIPGLRISRETGLPVWFKATNEAKNADKVIWQLSKTPFWGTAESYGSEAGIVASGTVDMSKGGEFPLDLKKLCSWLSKPIGSANPGSTFLAPQSAYQLYLRVVPLDKSGKPIGDPGTGLGFTYGPPHIDPGPVAAAMTKEPKIQLQVYVPYYWEHRYERIAPGVLDRDLKDDSDFILFAGTDGPHKAGDSGSESGWGGVVDSIEDASGVSQEEPKGAGSLLISKAVKVEIQVATSPFTDSATLGLVPPPGLVYRTVDTAPDLGADDQYGSTYASPLGRGIEYDQFVPSKQELEAMGGITYYARGIFYVPDSANPSILHPYPSETMTIAFRADDASGNQVKKIVVKSDIPYVQFHRYQPIQWQHPNYDEYFEVARPIEAEEMTFSIAHDGDFLLPYPQHIAKYGWTRDQYQALLDKMLPPGAVIHYVKAQPGFWDEFFGLLKSIYSGVQEAYADAKASTVSIVDYIPLIGDDARGYLKVAARAAIDYGLASIGLPPSLPNVDQLASGGMDYVMKVAVDEALASAGVPPDSAAAAEITEKVRKEVADGMGSELTKAMLAQKQNPLNVEFLRLELKKLYAPAYVDVFVCNYSKTRSTRAGDLLFTSGNGFDVYKTTKVPIPRLKPGEHVTIRVYLDHLRNKYDGYGTYFDEKYNGTSGKPYKMAVYTSFALPHVNQAAKEQGLKAAPLPTVTQFVYDHDAYSYRFEREFVPATPIYEPDSAPNTHDFLD